MLLGNDLGYSYCSYRCVELPSWLNEPNHVELSLLQSCRETKFRSRNLSALMYKDLSLAALRLNMFCKVEEKGERLQLGAAYAKGR